MSLPPSEIPSGAMRFNSDSQKLEYWNGSAWFQVHTATPNLASAGDVSVGARGLFGGGMDSMPSNEVNTIDYINISSTGNAQDFGDLTQARDFITGTSSNTRGVWFAGVNPGVDGVNQIDYVEMSSTGNAVDWGVNQPTSQRNHGGVGNRTRGIFAGTSGTNVIQLITISSAGTKQDFGDLIVASNGGAGINSPVRGVFAGGDTPGNINTMQFITITTTGNSQDFGDLTVGTGQNSMGNISNSVRGVTGGGQAPGDTNHIDYITFATTGNSANFGDLTVARRQLGACGSVVRGVFGGGYVSPATRNEMDYIIISTEGNAVDFGDLSQARRGLSGCSTGHGGL